MNYAPIDFVKTNLFIRVFQTVFVILKNPYQFFKDYSLESTPWSAYLFATTYAGLITVFAHGVVLFQQEHSFILTKFSLILMLDYFSILVLLPLFYIISVQILRGFNKLIGNVLENRTESDFKLLLNIFFFSTVFYPLVIIPIYGRILFLISLFLSVFLGLIAKNYNKLKSILPITILICLSLLLNHYIR